MSFNITDPYEFLHYCNEQEASIYDQNKLYIENLVIYDITYQTQHNSTILQLFSLENHLEKTLWGLEDIQFTQLNQNTIIEEVQKSNIEIIYSSTIPGGQLFKIGYIQEINAWLIYCNNATIAVRTIDDISEFAQQKFDSVAYVAELWFELLSNLNEQQITNLKFDLTNRTVYGQIVTQETIIYYNKDQLFFIGIKDVEFEQAQQLFQFYKLPQTKIAQFQFEQKILLKHLERIQRSDIELEAAGIFLNFGKQQYVLYSNEFVIFQNIQSLLLNNKNSADLKQLFKTFTFKPPRPLKFYQSILEEGQKIRNQYNNTENLIKKKFNQFIILTLYNFQNNKQFNWNQLSKIEELRQPISSYQPETLIRIPVYQEIIKNPENLFLIIPVSINGLGISNFARTFQQYYPQTQIINDIKEAKIRDSNVVILDYNHTPQEAESIINRDELFENKLILLPLLNNEFKEIKNPFSFEQIAYSLKRKCQSIESISQQIKKIKQFQQFVSTQFQNVGIIEFPFTDDSLQINHQYLKQDIIDVFFSENKNKINNLWKSLKEIQLSQSIIEDYDEEIKNIIKSLFPKLTKIQKQSVQVNQQVELQKNNQINEKQQQKKKELKVQQSYNPTYLPNSLNLQVLGGYNSKDKVNRFILDCLDQGIKHFKGEQEIVKIDNLFRKQITENGDQYFIQEREFLLQLLQIQQNDQSVRSLPYFKEFIPDKSADINIKTLFITLEGLIVALASQNSLPCQSPYPYVCFYTKNLKSKDSLDIISQTILQNNNLKQAYRDGKLQNTNDQNIFEKQEIRYKNKNIKIYVIALKDGISLGAVATDKI